MKRELLTILVLFLSILFVDRIDAKPDYHGSSRAQREYKKLIKLQSSIEHNLSQTYDFDINISRCDSIKNSLNKFILKHPRNGWGDTARTALQSWTDRKFTLVSRRDSLISELSSALYKKSEDTARHEFTALHIEQFDLITKNRHMDGLNLCLVNVYHVITTTRNHYENADFKIAISGSISVDDRRVIIDNNLKIYAESFQKTMDSKVN